MAAKLREKDGFYWVVVHHKGRRKWKKIGKDKREAQKVVHKVNAQLAVGEFSMGSYRKVPTVEEALIRWYEDYRPTFSPSFAQLSELNIRRHLIPAFGDLRVTELEERHLLQFISARTTGAQKPLAAGTLTNILSLLRRVMALEVDRGELARNPCRNLGRLLSKVKRQQSQEVGHVSSWTRDEVGTLLAVARAKEPIFFPVLVFLLSTGCRRGEALGLKWADVNFTVLGVSIDENALEVVPGFVEKKKLHYPIALDTSDNPAWHAFFVAAIPAMFLIDRQGRIVAEWRGEVSTSDVTKAVEELLTETSTTN